MFTMTGSAAELGNVLKVKNAGHRLRLFIRSIRSRNPWIPAPIERSKGSQRPCLTYQLSWGERLHSVIVYSLQVACSTVIISMPFRFLVFLFFRLLVAIVHKLLYECIHQKLKLCMFARADHSNTQRLYKLCNIRNVFTDIK